MKFTFIKSLSPSRIIYLFIFILISSQQVYSQFTWSRVFGGQYHDEGYFANQTSDGNYLMISDDWQRGQNLAKYNTNGFLLWQKFLPDSIYNSQNFIADQNNNIYFVSSNKIIKTDALGNILWIKSIPVGEDQFYKKVIFTDSNKNLLILGNTLICKADTSGNIKWQKIFSNIYNDIFFYDFLVSGNSYYLVGSRRANFYQPRAYIVKTDTSGNQIWDKYSNFTSTFYGLSKNSDFSFISCGIRSGFSSEYYVVKFALNGNYIWENAVLPDSTGVCSSIYRVNSNRYVMASSNGRGKGKVIQIDSSGNVLHNIQHYYHGLDWAMYNSIMGCSDSGFVIAAEYEFNENGWSDCLIIKTDKFGNTTPIGINSIGSSIPKQFKLFQNYPNPFNPKTIIKFQIPNSSDLKLIIFDVLGREVATLVNEQLQAGTYEVDFDATNYPSGVYYYKIISGEYTETRKAIIIK